MTSVMFCGYCGVRLVGTPARCPSCGEKFKGEVDYLGYTYQCRECRNWFESLDGNGLCSACGRRFIAAAVYHSRR